MSAELRAAHAALCLAHPQWGWAIEGESIAGELSAKGSSGKTGATSAHVVRHGATWCATILSGECDWKGYDDTAPGAFSRARINAGGRW